jgi:hypothetical protein
VRSFDIGVGSDWLGDLLIGGSLSRFGFKVAITFVQLPRSLHQVPGLKLSTNHQRRRQNELKNGLINSYASPRGTRAIDWETSERSIRSHRLALWDYVL